MRRSARASVGVCALLLAVACGFVRAGAPPVQREGVLGTSFEMQVAGADAQASPAIEAALGEIARLERQLSTWNGDSMLSGYNAGRLEAEALPDDVTAVLRLCEQWRADTQGAFSCRLGALVARWQQAEADGRLPDRAELRRQARTLSGMAPPAQGRLDPDAGLRFDVDGVAKGYILDRALARARAAAPAATGIRIDIGGDAVYWGEPAPGRAWRVGVADPRRPLDNGQPIVELDLRSRAIAASGHASRGHRIGRRRLSHILDPQEGWPVVYAPSSIVVAEDAATADALATALTVLPIRDGLARVDEVEGAAALVISDRGIPFASSRWSSLLAQPEPAAAAAVARGHGAGIAIDYRIPQQDSERYRQPYLAFWIERGNGEAVRQLLVLGDRSRWLGELPRWWRHYGRDDPAGAQGIARPTRAPGEYSLAWDGRDDMGRAMPSGRYVLRVEAAREHGGHEDLSLPFALGAAGPDLHAHGRSEIGPVVLRYDKPQPAPP